MKTMGLKERFEIGMATALLLLAGTGTGWAAGHAVLGLDGPAFTFTAKDGRVSTSDGNSLYMWGYANGSGPGALMQYPGPTLIVNQGDVVTVTLYNELPVPTSLSFPGHEVTAVGGNAGLLTQEAPAANGGPGGPVTYTFTAPEPGSYLYHSGTAWDLQGEMGLVGALIVRPAGFDAEVAENRRAYAHADSQYDQEFLFLLTDLDEKIHDQVELQVAKGAPVEVDMTTWYHQYWFINGRSGTDTVLPAGAEWLPHQPYDGMALFHPGDRVLMRIVGAGRDAHPFHFHGNHAWVIARDGRLLSSTPGAGADLAYKQFTTPSAPGTTFDQLFTWTGAGLGWDIYGHTSTNDPLQPFEYEPDHGKPFPVKLPPEQDITFGQMYSGSPFMGAIGTLPPGEGGFNPGAFFYMWHSHNERELCDGNIFPGGMLTFAIIIPHPPAPL